MELEHFLQALPQSERHTLKHCLQLIESESEGTQQYEDTLTRLITRLPYPIIQILELRNEKRLLCDRLIVESLQHLFKVDGTEFSFQLVNFLANFPLRCLNATSFRYKLPQILSQAALTDEVYLALLSRTESKLLDDVLVHLQRQWNVCDSLPPKEFVLMHALKDKKHFIPFLAAHLKDFRSITNIANRNNLLILKLANEFSNVAQPLSELGNISRWLEDFEITQSPSDLQEIHKFFFADFKRICTVLSFLKEHSGNNYKHISIESLLSSSGVLRLLYEHEIPTSFTNTHHILEAIYKLQQTMPAAKVLRDTELETFAYFSALANVYEVVMSASPHADQYYASQMQQLNVMLRHIRNLDVLCSVIEDIFRLIFIRWEHLRRDNDKTRDRKASMRTDTAGSSTADDEPVLQSPPGSPMCMVENTSNGNNPAPQIIRHGFICRGPALRAIFMFLKNFTTKKLHAEDYRDASEHLQMRFQKIVDIITEALWKYSVLEKIDDSLFRAGVHPQHMLDVEDLLQLVQLHVHPLEKSSSDDDSRDRTNYTSLTRRKTAKKRRRATFSGALSSRQGSGSITSAADQRRARPNLMVSSVSEIQDTSDPVMQLKARNMVSHFMDRGIIPKMLGSPENLAIMALVLKNFSDVKHIIETFNLKNTDLNRELLFVEQQQHVKQKLTVIYANYAKQEELSKSMGNKKPKATVEQIKNVAGKGFEVSKIINVIDNFAHQQKIEQSEEMKQLLTKYMNIPKYAFLQQFDADHMNVVLITDLILNLPFNREITMNIVIDIKRQQLNAGIASLASLASTNSNSLSVMAKSEPVLRTQLPREIGPMSLLENLNECQRLLENKSLFELLSDNYHSLKPHKLNLELQREHSFHKLFYKTLRDVGCVDSLRRQAALFANLQAKCNYYQRFSTYLVHLGRLVALRDSNVNYQTHELLKIDPYTLVGELIFECRMTPLEIEANVSALNLNLVHVIALNICPEVVSRPNHLARNTDPHKFDTIINYIANQNDLLAFVLQAAYKGDFSGRAEENGQQQQEQQQQQQQLQLQQYYLTESNGLDGMFLRRLLDLTDLDSLAQLFNGNKVVAALRSDRLDHRLVKSLKSLRDQLNILLHQMCSNALVDRSNNFTRQKEIDKLIVSLVKEDARNIHLVAHLHDIHLRAKLLQANFMKISTTRLAKELIESTLQHRDARSKIPEHLYRQLQNTLADIIVYAKVSEVMQFETWPQAYDFGLKTPNAIFQKLLQMHLYKLCYKWCCVVKLAERFTQYKKSLLAVLLDALLELNDEQRAESNELNKYLLQILETFPLSDCLSFLETHKDKFRSIELLQYTIEFLARNSNVNTAHPDPYRNYKASLIIFEHLSSGDRDQFWHLFKYPLLILEQLIMNAKFETLAKVLSGLRKNLHIQAQGTTQSGRLCNFCFDKRGNVYDIHTKASGSPHKLRFQLGADSISSTNSAFILLNFNLYQKDHFISSDCIDLLLRIYATKALDYYISDVNSSSGRFSQITDMQSLDSLCGSFQMPKHAPIRAEWVRDEDASHCMCCRRAAFAITTRRHHCRRCGRVVCFACSTHRMRIPDLYDDVEVRICNDCHRITEEMQQRLAARSLLGDQAGTGTQEAVNGELKAKEAISMFKWELSGNITHDKLVREEFCYEHAPSVALCLSILSFHHGQQKCVELLLYHCRKLEKLIVPNPEVDYELVAKMMNCLALAAKVRGGPAEVETIREHSEIIMSVVQNGCEALIPPGPLNNHSLRKLADSLVQAERWQLALEVHLKCGFPTAGVMAAHGLSCLRAGCFDTARDKFAHCLPKLSNELANAMIYKAIFGGDSNVWATLQAKMSDIPHIKRPQRGPPLLLEILKIIETTPTPKPQPETLRRASLIRSSNTSLASMLNKRKEFYTPPMSEPALNVLTSLASLRRIASGHYSDLTVEHTSRHALRHSRSFDECIHYVLTYGSHRDIISFLMNYDELSATLRYLLAQSLEPDYFIHNVFLVMLHHGRLPELIAQMQQFDEHLLIWKHVLLQTCRYLETQNHLNTLYQLQLLLKDPIRASMTCVKFYTMNCDNYMQLHANASHLHNAHKHLQSELEIAQWESINLEQLPVKQRSSGGSAVSALGPNSMSRRHSSASTSSFGGSFLMQMDARSLNTHINTITKQLEVAKFLAKCEKENSTVDLLITDKYLKLTRIDTTKAPLPTLFDSNQSKIQICILILLCGKNIEEGFGLAYSVIQAYRLQPLKVYGATAKYLARSERLPEVEKLINCISSNNGMSTRDIDEILSIAINSAINTHEPEVKTTLDALAKRIHSIELRISSHIFIGQLKSAYLLANKHERLTDIRRILRQAELTNQLHIKRLCERKLSMHTSPGPVV